jgi:hypothetical protein
MFKLIQTETNRYAKQQINKKKQEGSMSPKFVFALWNFAIIKHMSILRSSSQDYWSLRPIIHTPHAASVGTSQSRFLTLLTFRFNNNNAKAARGHPAYVWPTVQNLASYWHTHHKISGCLHNGRTADHWRGNMLILRAYIISCVYERKAP